jgi:hypothetical protein
VDFPCLDCGGRLRVMMRDGVLMDAEAAGYMAYVAVPFWKWFEDVGYA